MKKVLCLLLVLVFVLSFGACSGKKALTVYAVETDALYISALNSYKEKFPDINIVTFPSYEGLNEQMTTELLSGKGPDVLLFNGLYSTTDYYKLSRSGLFLSLNDYMQSVEDDSFPVLLESGKVRDDQCVLPLSWNLLQAYTTQDLIQQQSYEDKSIYEAFRSEAERLADDNDYAFASLQLARADVLNLFLENAGTAIVDKDSNTFAADKAQVEETATFVKTIYDNLDSIRAINTKYSNDFAGAVAHFSFLTENYPFMHNLRFYQSLYPNYCSQDMYASYFPNGEEGLSAQIIHYGAINANTRHADEAWELLKYILQFPFSMDFSKYDAGSVYYAPVSVAGYENCVVQLETQEGQGPKMRLAPLNEDNAAFLRSVPEKVTQAHVPNPVLGNLIQECMNSYLSGTESFDEGFTALENRITRYLQE